MNAIVRAIGDTLLRKLKKKYKGIYCTKRNYEDLDEDEYYDEDSNRYVYLIDIMNKERNKNEWFIDASLEGKIHTWSHIRDRKDIAFNGYDPLLFDKVCEIIDS